jgi:hypothetical protein
LALLRRVEAASKVNEDRKDAPYGHAAPFKPSAPPRPPLATLAAQVLGGRSGGPDARGYDAYLNASRLLTLESRRVDVSGL